MALIDKLTNIANAIRAKTGGTDPLTLDGMVEAINGITAGGGGTGDPDLPAGYRRCNFIRFTNGQIVDSGIVCNQDTKIRTLFTREADAVAYLYGVASTNNVASVTAYLSNNGTWRFGNKGIARPHSVYQDVIRNAIVDSSGIQHETGKATLSGVSDFETVGTLLIGACRDADGTLPVVSNAKYTGRIFIFEMWSGEEQVLKLIPVTDGTAFRFWDAVNQAFHDSITDTPLAGGNL